ncbi:MAG: hypothetical protein CBE47_01835 [Pelagibacteraceae bacterium TMED287]|nr:MAG: hypothetical protein CBE47_01835 [Pelagibacteraceae bacterium TMED287]
MGLFNGTNLSVEAILTTRGRELLSKDGGKLQITKFALSDEDIDYTLFDDTHPNGTVSFGKVLESVIPLEATPAAETFKSYLVPDELSFEDKILRIPVDTDLESATELKIKPKTTVKGDILDERYLFTIQNTNVLNFVSDDKNKTNTFTGEEVTVISSRINPGATTLVTISGIDSRLTEVMVVNVIADNTTSKTSPFDGKVKVTNNID